MEYFIENGKRYNVIKRLYQYSEGTKKRAVIDIIKWYDNYEIKPDIPFTFAKRDPYIYNMSEPVPFLEDTLGMTPTIIFSRAYEYWKQYSWSYYYGTLDENMLLNNGDYVDISMDKYCFLPSYFSRSQEIKTGFFHENV